MSTALLDRATPQESILTDSDFRVMVTGKLNTMIEGSGARPDAVFGLAPTESFTGTCGAWLIDRESNHERMLSMKLKGKVALITGSSRGIGAAMARRFAENGASIILHGRDHEALEKVRARIEKSGARATIFTADLTDPQAVESMRAGIEANVGPVEILVANAGGSFARPALVEDIPLDEWRAAIEGNLTATFLTIRTFLPGMKERGSGIIITMSSAAARKPYPAAPVPYAVAKAGVQLLTQDLAAQAGPFGIRVNCIAPETILTERNIDRIPDQQQQMLRDQHPLRRLGTPDDIADAALFLASDQASWVTGIVLDVAGGAVLV